MEEVASPLQGEAPESGPDVDAFRVPPPRVTLSADGVNAYLTLFEAGAFTLEQVTRSIERAGIVDVDWDKVARLVAGTDVCEGELIANGTPAKPPIDARIEYLFKRTHRPREHGGRIDWHDLGTIISVTEGTALARRYPPVEGEPGRTAKGKVIAVKAPKDVDFNLGLGVELAADDPCLAIAEMSGAVKLDAKGHLEVENLTIIEGDVGVATGDIDYNGCLIITGNVTPGYRVEATADIEIRGSIESAMVIAGGSVRADAIFGTEDTWVGAKRDIVARFANNAALKASENVVIQREAVNCSIEADGMVVVGGTNPADTGTIKGGSISAGTLIESQCVDTLFGRTKLRAGFDWVVKPKLGAINKHIAALREELGKIRAAIAKLNAATDLAMPGKPGLIAQLMETQADRLQQISALQSEQSRLKALLDQPGAVIVHGPVVGGTHITVDGKVRLLPEDSQGMRFSREADLVIGTALNE